MKNKLFFILISFCVTAYSNERGGNPILGVSFSNMVISDIKRPVEDFALVKIIDGKVAIDAYIGNHPDSSRRTYPDNLGSGEYYYTGRRVLNGNSTGGVDFILYRTTCRFPMYVALYASNPTDFFNESILGKINTECVK